MSSINRTTLNALVNLFANSNYRECTLYSNDINGDLNYLNNNVFNLFLRMDCTNSHVIVPLFCRDYMERSIMLNLSRGEFDTTEISIALFINGLTIERRTSNAIFKTFTEVGFSKRLAKVVTSKGEIYYGGYGLILDKNMNPIFLCTLEGDLTEERLVYKTAKIYVSPSVFFSDNILEKGIVKTILPAYMEHGVLIYSSYTGVEKIFKRKDGKVIPEVIVKDFTDIFFVKPTRPKPCDFTKDKVNDFLLKHVNDIKVIAHL